MLKFLINSILILFGLSVSTAQAKSATYSGNPFNDPGVTSNWMHRESKYNGIDLFKAYNHFGQKPSQEIIVAIIDTGVDFNHEDLRDNMWTNSGEIPNNAIDDDNNGYIDDVYGINTLNRNSQGQATGDVFDQHLHGTLSAGVIAAKQNNKKGIAGIASHVKIMALKAIPSEGDEKDKDVAEALLYAAKNGAKIINCSFGKRSLDSGTLLGDTLELIAEKYGVLVVTAAGNYSNNLDQFPIYPASLKNDNLIVVTAINQNGDLASFANYGPKDIDVAAPGVDIYTTLPNSKYGFYYGTSIATPVVTGIAAEIWSKFKDLNYKELKSILIKSSVPTKKLRAKIFSGAQVNLYNALVEAEKYAK